MLAPKYWASWIAVLMMASTALIPNRARRMIAKGCVPILRKVGKKPKRITHANLKACFPNMPESERDKIIDAMIFNFLRVGLGMGALACHRRKDIESAININGIEHIERARDQGKPIVFLVPHLIGIEFAGARLSALGLPMMGMVKHHKNPVFNWFTCKQRRRWGGTVYHRDAGLRTLVQGLRRGECFLYLPDQDHGPEKSVFAPFFATHKATLPVIGRLARCGNAVVLPLAIDIAPNEAKMQLNVSAPLELPESMTKQEEAELLNQEMERIIAAHPCQYMWFLKVLQTRQEGESRLY